MASNPFGSTSSAPFSKPAEGTNPHQEKMKEVRNPYQGFQSNKEIQDERQAGKTPSRTANSMETSTPSKAVDQESLAKRQEVSELSKKIGNFAFEVEAEVNKFLTQGTATIGATGSTQPVFKDGVWAMGEAPGADFSQMARQKTQELEGIKKLANTFYSQDDTGKWAPKKFDKVVSEYYEGLDGSAKEVVDKKASNLINLAKQINLLENQGQGQSAQAQALRQQLEDQDEGGVVSGLWKAMDSFKKFVGDEFDEDSGMTWYGDQGGEGFKLSDIMSLDESKIMEELKKAATSSSGLFGGSFEANIAKTLDLESEEYKKAMSSEADYRNQLMKSSKQYFVDQQVKLLGVADKLAASFREIAPQVSSLVGDELAEEWFAVLQEGGPDDFAMAVNNLLFDNESGLGIETRRELTKLIGDVMKKKGVDLGFDSNEGLISSYINEIATRGYITNDKGDKIKPSAIQKLEILEAFDNQDYTKVKTIMDDLITNGGINLVSQIDKLASATTTSEIARGLNEFKNSLVTSLQQFKGSDTERLFSEVLLDKKGIDSATFNTMNDADKQTLLLQVIKENPNLTAESVKADIAIKKANLAKESKLVNDSLNATRKQYEQQVAGIPALTSKLEGVFMKAQETAQNKVAMLMGDVSSTAQRYTQELADSKLRLDYGQADFVRVGNALAMYDILNNQGTKKDTAMFETLMTSMPKEFSAAFNQYNNDRNAFLKAVLNGKMSITMPNPTSLATTYMTKDTQYQSTIEAVKKEIGIAQQAETKLTSMMKEIDTAKVNMDRAVKASEAVFTDPNTIASLVQERARKVESGILMSQLQGNPQATSRSSATDYVAPVTQGKEAGTAKSVTQAKDVADYTTNILRGDKGGTTGFAKYIEPQKQVVKNDNPPPKPTQDKDGTVIDSPASEPKIGVGSAYAPEKRVMEGIEVQGWSYLGVDGKKHFMPDVGALRSSIASAANNGGLVGGTLGAIADWAGLYTKPLPQQQQVAKQLGITDIGDFDARTIQVAIANQKQKLFETGVSAGMNPEKLKGMETSELLTAVTNAKSNVMNTNMTQLKSYLNNGLISPESLAQLNTEQALSNIETFKQQLKRAVDQKKAEDTRKANEKYSKENKPLSVPSPESGDRNLGIEYPKSISAPQAPKKGWELGIETPDSIRGSEPTEGKWGLNIQTPKKPSNVNTGGYKENFVNEQEMEGMW